MHIYVYITIYYHIPRTCFRVLYIIFTEGYSCFCSKPHADYKVVIYGDLRHRISCLDDYGIGYRNNTSKRYGAFSKILHPQGFNRIWKLGEHILTHYCIHRMTTAVTLLHTPHDYSRHTTAHTAWLQPPHYCIHRMTTAAQSQKYINAI
jgi:hypothetical protein